jgi:glucose dehydrogenase
MKIREKYDVRFLAFILLLATAIGVTTGVGEDWQAGLRSFGVIMGFWLIVPLVPWGRLELLQARDKDERQHQLGMEAAAIAGIIMIFVALGGAMVDAAHGREGTYSTMCVVGGVSFLLACLVLPRVRR